MPLSLTITGTNESGKVGDTLTAEVTGAAAAEYQWYADGEAIEDETDKTLLVTPDMLGAELSVKVTAEDGEVVYSDETEAVTAPTLLLEDAVQVSSNEVKITFDQDASDYVNKDNLTIGKADGTLDLPINSLEWSLDGTVAKATVAAALEDGVDYSVAYEDSEVFFSASIGEVAYVVVDTASAEVNTKTPIKFSLYNEQRVDITSSVNIDSTCTVTVDGSATYDTSRPSKATITMDTVDSEADVTVTYNSGKKDAEDIEATQTIVCVPAEAVVGAKMYANTDKINANSLSAKFYLDTVGSSSDIITVEEGAETTNLYFCALDENGDAISYDTYEVESSNDDVASANATVDTGKYARITVTGNTIGSANVVIKAEKNGASTTYTIPVAVITEGVLDKITVAVTRSTMSNAIDDDYYGVVSYTAYDTNGEKTTKNLTQDYETVNASTKEGQIVEGLDALVATGFVTTAGYDTDAAAVTGSGKAGKYVAKGALGGSQSIKVTVSQGDIVKEKTVGVTVRALPDTAWNITANADKQKPAVTYAIEFKNNKNVIDEADGAAKAKATARLYAMIGSDFAGYVRQGANGPVIGNNVGGTYTIPGAKATAYIKAPGDGKYVQIEATADGDTLEAVTYKQTKAAPQAAVTGVPSVYDGATFKLTAAAASDDTDKPSLVNGLKVLWVIGPNTDTTAARVPSAVLTKPTSGYTLTITSAAAQATDATTPGAETALTTAIIDGLLGNATTALTDADSVALLGEVKKITSGAATPGTATAFDAAGVDPKSAVATTAAYTWTPGTTAGGTLAIDTYPTITAADLATAIDNKLDASWTVSTLASAPTGVALTGVVTLIPGYLPVTVANSIIRVNNDSVITDVHSGVKFGSKFSADGNVFNGKTNVQKTKDFVKTNALTALAANGTITVSAVGAGPAFYVDGDSTKDGYFARPGAYSVVFTYKNLNGKELEASAGLTVKNTLYVPKVTVKDREVDSLNMSTVVENLKASVDLNNNNSDHFSIDSTSGYSAVSETGVTTAATATNNRLTIKYVAVVEDGITFFVPINATFKTK